MLLVQDIFPLTVSLPRVISGRESCNTVSKLLREVGDLP